MSVPLERTVDEIPDAMKKLATFIARGFYGPEHGILMDQLKRRTVMKEDELRHLLKLDIKQLRAILVQLKRDMLVKERSLAEEREEGARAVKTLYYFINYRSLLNVTKYKLDQMRRKLESEDATATKRAAYKCSRCSRPYTDLEIDRLIDDYVTGRMACIVCRSEVVEDPDAGPSQDTRSLLAQFNQQMQGLFGLLQELDGVQLAPHLLEPPPPATNAAAAAAAAAVGGAAGKAGGAGTQGFAGNLGGRRPNFELYQGQDLQVNIGDGAGSAQPAAKETPAWLLNTPAAPAATGAETGEAGATASAAPAPIAASVQLLSPTRESVDDAVAATLRAHEALGSPTLKSPPHKRPHEEEEEDDDDELEEVEEDDEEVLVAGERMKLSQVMSQPRLIDSMSKEEKEAYIAASQRVFENHDHL